MRRMKKLVGSWVRGNNAGQACEKMREKYAAALNLQMQIVQKNRVYCKLDRIILFYTCVDVSSVSENDSCERLAVDVLRGFENDFYKRTT